MPLTSSRLSTRLIEARRALTDLPCIDRHARRSAGVLLCALFLGVLAGCAATPQTRTLLQERPVDLPAAFEIESTPFFAQKRYQCGPAALATVLTHAGWPAKPAELVDEIYIPERQGTLRTEIRAATRARGLVPYPLEGNLTALLREVANGSPVLVMQNLAFDWFPQWHYAVVVGYDLDEGDVVLRSGTRRRHVVSLRLFERTWARSGHWAQVVVDAGEIPGTARPVQWLQAVHELEPSHADRAMRGYRSATARWPDSSEAWMARGNAAYAAGGTDEARTAFGRAIEAAPDRAAGWNNLAYALARTGCGRAARRAARCAVSLAPDEEGPRDTLRDMQSVEPNDAGYCAIPACPAGAANGS